MTFMLAIDGILMPHTPNMQKSKSNNANIRSPTTNLTDG